MINILKNRLHSKESLKTMPQSAENTDTSKQDCDYMKIGFEEIEEFNFSLLENAPNPVGVITPDTSIKYVNPAFEKLSGFTSAELIGTKAPYPWWPEEIRESCLTNIRKAVSNGSKKFKNEQVMQNRKGERFWVELNSSSVMHNGEVKYHIANWLDITERKQAEEALAESEEFSTSLLENAPNPIVVINPDTSIKYANPAFEKLSGFTSAEVIGTKAPYPCGPKKRNRRRMMTLNCILPTRLC